MPLLQFLFSFQGRIRRRDLWLYYLGLLGFIALWAWNDGLRIEDYDKWFYPYFSSHFKSAQDFPDVVVGVLILWSKLAVLIKRWHDRNKSGWWVLINLVPLIGAIWTFIECGFLKGTSGSNRYGASPIPTAAGQDIGNDMP
jgi:uncharacterized membrane protein YhaH (DUF805 family)